MVEIDSGGKSIKKKKKLTGRQLSLRFSKEKFTIFKSKKFYKKLNIN